METGNWATYFGNIFLSTFPLAHPMGVGVLIVVGGVSSEPPLQSGGALLEPIVHMRQLQPLSAVLAGEGARTLALAHAVVQG